jgi:hypothetical protein
VIHRSEARTKARDFCDKIGMPHMVKPMNDWLAKLPPDD